MTVAAALADGRTGSASETNDGGAWLLNRNARTIGHVNRVVGEIATTIGPFNGAFDVTQAKNVVIVHDRSAGTAVLIDTGLGGPGATVAVPSGATVTAVRDGVVIFDPTAGRLWQLDRAAFGALASLDDMEPTLEVGPAGLAAVGLDGSVAVSESDGSTVHLVGADGSIARRDLDVAPQPDTGGIEVVDETDRVTAVTVVGDIPVLLKESGTIVVVDGDVTHEHRLGDVVALQQPSSEEPSVVVVHDDGLLSTVGLESGDTRQVKDAVGDPSIRPIVHDDCVWSISLEPTTFHYCETSTELASAGSNITLALVNGWVWVNDVDQGAIWFVQEDDLEVRQISDWTAALFIDEDADESDSGESGDTEQVADADADEIVEVENLDDDDRNEPPVAEPDEAATRQGRPVIVDVLDNDTDPDNDPLAVVELTGVDPDGFTPDGVRVTILPDGSGLLVQSSGEFVGDSTFGYVITDGRGERDEAAVTVSVRTLDPEGNRPPVPVTDNVEVRAGRSVTVNVLDNDTDPDGDHLVLAAADGGDGNGDDEINWTPDGLVTFAPDVSNPDGTIIVSYTVADEFEAVAEGIVRIVVRNADSNQEPDARNDVDQATVGRTVTLDVLANDADADGDPLVAQNLRSADGADTTALLAPDGGFVFRPEAAGTYRFTYDASDGPEVDTAQIRIEVQAEIENRPPVAVVDELSLAIGERRLIRVLDNDGDPDGDVIGLVDWTGTDGLEISEVPGVGFNVLATPSASARSEFRYWISDGLADAVQGTVVVAALAREPVDYPPVANFDGVDVRSGGTVQVPVLRNDVDPEGRALRIVAPLGSPPDAAEGRVRVSPDGQSLVLTVAPDQRFGFEFSYDVEDPAGNRASAVVQVRIVPANQPNRAPIAAPDVAATPSAVPVTIDVRLNDYDPDGDPITVESIAEQPTNGTVTLDDDGSIVYVPNDGFAGTDRFVYTLVDGFEPLPGATGVDDEPGRALGEVLIGVIPPLPGNRDPIATDDVDFPEIQVGADDAALSVLDNDSDPDGDVVVVVDVTTPPIGTASVSADGRSVVYGPPSTLGPDGDRQVAFAYTVSDGRGGTASAQIVIDLVTVATPVAPVAVDDQVGPAVTDSVVTLDPRANDLDPDGDADALRVESDDPALTVLGDGSVELIVPASTGDIEYVVRDEQGLVSEVAVITVFVTENEAPVIEPIDIETPFETSVTIAVHDSVSDPDGDVLFLGIGDASSGGGAESRPSGVGELFVEFTPDDGFVGPGSFDFVVRDGNGHNLAGTATITVLPPENRPPRADQGAFTFDAGTTNVIRLADLVTDPDGPDGHVFSVADVSGPIELGAVDGRGEIEIGSDLAAGEATASFVYTVDDGANEASNTVTISLVEADYAAPTTRPDTVTVPQGEATGAIAVLDNDADNSPAGLVGDGLTLVAVGTTEAGTARTVGDTVVFVPDPDFFGTATFGYTVRDGRDSVDYQSEGVVTVEVVGLPAAPQAATVDSVGNSYLVVGWRSPQGAAGRAPVSGYTLRYEGDDGSTGEEELTTSTRSFRWNGLQNAVRYCFSVIAENEVGVSEPSPVNQDLSCGVPDVRPERPAAPTITPRNGEIVVDWVEPASQGSAIIDYQVRISGGLQRTSPELGAADTRYVWPDLVNGTEYKFEVRAKNSATEDGGWSDWSPPGPRGAGTVSYPYTVPDAPNRPEADRGDGQVSLTWTAPYNGGDRIIRYEVERDTNEGTWERFTPEGNVNSHPFDGLTNGEPVRFRVRAVNRDPLSIDPGNPSPWSLPATPCGVPAPPTDVRAFPGDQEALVRWRVPADNGCDITGYSIIAVAQGADPETVTAGASATATEGTVRGLTNGRPYRFQVAALNAATQEDNRPERFSNPSGEYRPFGRPGAPVITSLTTSGMRMNTIVWTEPDDNGAEITDYQLRTDNGPWVPLATAATSITRQEEQAGVLYTYQIRAVNDAGAGGASNAESITTLSAPGRPTVTATASRDTARITADFESRIGTGVLTLIDITEVKLVRGSCESGGTGLQNASDGETAVWDGVTPGVEYRACVRHHNEAGWGQWGSDVATHVPRAPVVRANWGPDVPPAQSQCSVTTCRYVEGAGSDFTPNTTVSVRCQSRVTSGSPWQNLATVRSLAVDSSGNAFYGNWCQFDRPGEQVRLVYITSSGASIPSNVITY